MSDLRTAAQQALEALLTYEQYIQPLTAVFGGPRVPEEGSASAKVDKAITDLRAALAQPDGGGNLPPPLQVPPEIVAALTTTDLAWLETRRLTRLWQELGQMRWAGADEGWDRAIEAVRSRLNDECQAVLDWKAKADQSQATAIELLQRMKGLNDE